MSSRPTMNRFLRLPLVGIAVLSASTAWAVVITEPTRTFTVGTDIADLQDPPVSFLQIISDSSIASLTRVEVGLNLVGRGSGGFAGEMFVSLNKDLSLTSVLVNRVGFSGTDSIGLPYDGWNVTLSDLAASDLHTVIQSLGVLNGTFQPDGRTDPTSSLRPDSSVRRTCGRSSLPICHRVRPPSSLPAENKTRIGPAPSS